MSRFIQWWKALRDLPDYRNMLSERQEMIEKAVARFSREQAKANLLWEKSVQKQNEALATLQAALKENQTALAKLESEVERRSLERVEKSLLPELMDLLDDLWQAVAAMNEVAATKPEMMEWAEGLRAIHTKGEKILSFWDITSFTAQGKPFNPALHSPVEVIEQPGISTPMVAAEVYRGYIQGNRLLRQAKVVVAKPGAAAGAADGVAAEAAAAAAEDAADDGRGTENNHGDHIKLER
ncbi:MAG TPA: nucleotide exchange factor GrpE [Firmicutes bacterium]|nr:nucleotide exchange factor GrpE [Bacillota bacterium]